MARDRLTALQVKRAHEKGEPVLLPDGAGLYLRKQPRQARPGRCVTEIDAQLKASAAKKARGKFKELAEDWYETEIKGGRLKHPVVPRRYLDKYMLPEFGDTVPAEITPAMAARLLARVAKKAPTAANDLLRHMRRVF